MKRRKCMADGGMIEKVGDGVRQATRGIADFLNIGRPATTEVQSGLRTQANDSSPIVPADTRPDMPQERNPRRFADEVDQRKQARSGGYADGGMLLNDNAERINQQAQVGYHGGIASFLSGVKDAAIPMAPPIGPNLAQSSAGVGMSPQSQGLLTGIKDYGTTPAQLASMGKPAFVNSDGSPRDMGASVPQPAQPSPTLTMKERDIAAGLDPNRAYRPGTAGDPYASGVRQAPPADLSREPFQPMQPQRRRKPAGYADGGMVRFSGAGGPRDDQIPVKVAGEEIKVSDGEAAVILPAKTAANPAALGIIGGIIRGTNDGRTPKIGMSPGGGYKAGSVPDEEDMKRAQAATVGLSNPLTIFGGQVPPTAQEMYGSGPKATVTVPPGTVGGNISQSGSYPREEGGAIKNVGPALRGIAEFARPAYDLSPSMRALQTTGRAIGDVFADSAAAQKQGTTYADAKAQRLAMEASNEGRPSALLALNQSRPVQTVTPPSTQRPPVAAQQPAATITAQDTTPAPTVSGSGIVSSEMGKGFDPTKLQMAPGYGMASNAAGKTLSIGPSQYIAVDGTPTSRWEDTQAYQDAIARNARDKMRLAEMQAQRLGADPMAVQAASQGIASAVLANKQTQAQIGRSAELQGMIKRAAAEQDAGKRQALIETILAAQGKDMKGEKEWTVFAGGQDAIDDGMGGKKTVDRPPVAFNHRTQQVIRLDGSSAGNTVPGSAPYSDGTRLQGKDGKMYVVRNGAPVLEGK